MPLQRIGIRRCRDCNKQCRERFVDDTGLCAMCGLTLLVIPPNPLFQMDAES